MSEMTKEQLEGAILLDVVTSFANLKQSTPRRSLLIKYKNQPASVAIFDLTSHNIIRRKNNDAVTPDEEYLPSAAAFELCGDNRLREEAKHASTVVLTTLQNMFIGEQKKEGFNFQDLKRHVEYVYTNQTFDDETLKLGLYIARDLGSLNGYRLTQPDETEVEWFQIAESAANMPNPKDEWDRVMAGYKRSVVAEETEAPVEAQWERVKRLGGGGQSDVFLVRSPARATQRAACLRTVRTALDQDKRAELADAMWSYSRPDSLSELGAMKVFRIRDEGGEQQAVDRLKQEFKILSENRPGLPKLLASNESERWIVTEFFPDGTLEDNILLYKGKPALALKALLSLVNTVAQLHDEGIVHRDIKPANVFVKQNDELVLGDFGIVFLPEQPARLTRTNESVGPHDYMPPWADIGGRLEKIDCNFDVYMLGKLLWCMVAGRLVLQREWFQRPQNDVTVMFKHDPHAHMINTILEKCVVERQQDCVGIHDIRAMVIAFVSLIEQDGQLLQPEVPRPCHVCGHGEYQPEVFGTGKDSVPVNMRFWKEQEINLKKVDVFTCNSCGHMALFRTRP
jgi:serine/threonine protein kinase